MNSAMKTDEVRLTFAHRKAIITDSHVVYKSGKHGSAYVNKDAIYPYVDDVVRLCEEMARRIHAGRVIENAPDVLVGLVAGSVVLAHRVAEHLSTLYGREILSVYAEPSADGSSFVIKRGFDKLIAGKRSLPIEDVVTTGGSLKKVVEAIRSCNGVVVGAFALCNRGRITGADLGDIPEFEALLNVDLDMWEQPDCPLCKKGVPINTDVGHGREYLARLAAEQPQP